MVVPRRRLQCGTCLPLLILHFVLQFRWALYNLMGLDPLIDGIPARPIAVRFLPIDFRDRRLPAKHGRQKLQSCANAAALRGVIFLERTSRIAPASTSPQACSTQWLKHW